MYWTISMILLMLWLLGLVTGYSVGGAIHVLPVVANVIVLIQVVQGVRITKEVAANCSGGVTLMIHKKWRLRNILNNSVSIFILCLFVLIIGCTSGRTAYRMVNKNDTNIRNLEKTKIGMTRADVLTLMGKADKSEEFKRKDVTVEILYYLTSGSYSPSLGWQNIGSTPVVFEAGILKGWAKYFDEQRLGSPRNPKDQ